MKLALFSLSFYAIILVIYIEKATPMTTDRL